jgi:glycolate oxidase FAD binding subunit
MKPSGAVSRTDRGRPRKLTRRRASKLAEGWSQDAPICGTCHRGNTELWPESAAFLRVIAHFSPDVRTYHFAALGALTVPYPSKPDLSNRQMAFDALNMLLGPEGFSAWAQLEPDGLRPTVSHRQSALQAALTPDRALLGVATPATPTALAATLALAQQQGWPVLPCGNGSKITWGGPVAASLAVSTARLNQVIDHAVGDLTVTAQTGIQFADLQAQLAQSGQFLALDPSFPADATLGGIVATGDTGSLRHRYNSVRDQLLGVTFARADGALVQAGGRVVKNVAGYDLMKLLTGSYGTLGVITQVTFRTYPFAPVSDTVVLQGDPAALGSALQALHSSALTPVAFDLLSGRCLQALGLTDHADHMGLLLRFQTVGESVAQQADRASQLAQSLGLSIQRPTNEADLWQQITQQRMAPAPTARITAKIGVKPSDATATLQSLEVMLPEVTALIHVGSGVGLVTADGTAADWEKARSHLQGLGGFLSILQAPLAFKQAMDPWGYAGNALNLMKTIKQQFDPQNQLSPGRFVGGI